ncbi:MAG: hypothetical protein JOZ65_22110 [Chloroflexi bacterium]|nr:hypothetical protein [Chloroflexota bacterium]
MSITVLNPTSSSESQPLQMARRLESLEGRVVGVLDNHKMNAERIFFRVERSLRERYGVREVLWRRKHNFSAPAPAALIAELAACDAIITGVGD